MRKPTYEELLQRVRSLEEAAADSEKDKDALTRMQRLLNGAQQLGNIGSWEFDPTTNQSVWAKSLYQLFGYHRSEVEDPCRFFIDHIVHPKDRATVCDSFQEVRKSKKKQSFGFRGIDRSGEEKTYRGMMVPEVGPDGGVRRVFGLNMEITEIESSDAELRDSREFFRFLSESSPLGVFQTDARGNVEYLTPNGCR